MYKLLTMNKHGMVHMFVRDAQGHATDLHTTRGPALTKGEPVAHLLLLLLPLPLQVHLSS